MTLVRPVVTYGSETWTLTVGDERLLGAFERRILRRVYGPINENGDWRIRYNQEIDALIDGKTIVRFIKAQRIRWLGHVERMAASEIPKRMLRGRLYNRRRRGRPRNRWMDEVSRDLGTMGIRGWRTRTEDRASWRNVVQEAKAHPGL